MSSTALANRAIRNIQAELHFLADSNVINHSTLNEILSLLPDPSSTITNNSTKLIEPSAPALIPKSAHQPQQPTPPPEQLPSYTPTTSTTPSINPGEFYCTALWAYPGTAEGDLSFPQGARILVSKKENAEWWLGRVIDDNNVPMGESGIFPCSYVKADAAPESSEKGGKKHIPGDMGARDALYSSKKEEGDSAGKRFGKKLGNAAIFGAGASLGGKVVGAIF